MTEADLDRWEAQSNASGAPGMHEELLACIAEVRRLRALLAGRCEATGECQAECESAGRMDARCALRRGGAECRRRC
jgi:hypothetical protein